MNNEITLGVLMFTAVVLSLVAIILVARAKLVSSGAVTISINDDPEKSITVAAGDKLLQTLSAQGMETDYSRLCKDRRSMEGLVQFRSVVRVNSGRIR